MTDEDAFFRSLNPWEREALGLERLKLARARLDEAEQAVTEATEHLHSVVRGAVKAGIDGKDIAPIVGRSAPWVSSVAKGLKPKKGPR